jgi:hypothetical protein
LFNEFFVFSDAGEALLGVDDYEVVVFISDFGLG